MIKCNVDNEKIRNYYKELAYKGKEIVERAGNDWKTDHDENGNFLGLSSNFGHEQLKIFLFMVSRDNSGPGGSPINNNMLNILSIYHEDTLLLDYYFDYDYYERNEKVKEWEKGIDIYYKSIDKLEEARNRRIEKQRQEELAAREKREREEREGRDEFNIIRDASLFLGKLYNILSDEEGVHRSFYDTRRALNRWAISIETEVHPGDIYEYINNYPQNGGSFKIYNVFYRHELVARFFGDISYDFSEHVVFKPGPWLQKLKEIIQEKKQEYGGLVGLNDNPFNARRY